MIYRTPMIVMVGLWFALTSAAASSQDSAFHPVQEQRSTTLAETAGYVLGPGDVLHIEALNHPDFNVKTPVAPDGTIQLPYLGSMLVTKTTISTLRSRIAEELAAKGIFSNISLEAD